MTRTYCFCLNNVRDQFSPVASTFSNSQPEDISSASGSWWLYPQYRWFSLIFIAIDSIRIFLNSSVFDFITLVHASFQVEQTDISRQVATDVGACKSMRGSLGGFQLRLSHSPAPSVDCRQCCVTHGGQRPQFCALLNIVGVFVSISYERDDNANINKKCLIRLTVDMWRTMPTVKVVVKLWCCQWPCSRSLVPSLWWLGLLGLMRTDSFDSFDSDWCDQ